MTETPRTPDAARPACEERLLREAAWRVTRGAPTAAEVAALAVVLNAMLRGRADGPAGLEERDGVYWGTVSRPAHPAARSWVHQPLPGWRSAA